MKKQSLVLLNIKMLISRQSIFLLFLVITQIVACLAVFLSIGAIHNTRNEQKDIDVRLMFFDVTQQDSEQIETFKAKADKVISIIPNDMIFWAAISGIAVPGTEIKYTAFLKSSNLSYMTKEQIENGEKVVAVGQYDTFGNKKVGDMIDINGEQYTVVSNDDYISDIILPIKSTNSDFTANSFRIELNQVPDKELAENISNLMGELFPSEDMYTPEIPDLTAIQFNRTMILTSIIVISIVVLNLSCCYCYLFVQRKKMIATYMICGSSHKAAANMMILESAMISFICYLIAVFIIHPFKTSISNIYPAATQLYSLLFFAIVGAIYIFVTAFVLKIMYSTLLRKTAIELKRGV